MKLYPVSLPDTIKEVKDFKNKMSVEKSTISLMNIFVFTGRLEYNLNFLSALYPSKSEYCRLKERVQRYGNNILEEISQEEEFMTLLNDILRALSKG